jgi:hypothetical protein
MFQCQLLSFTFFTSFSGVIHSLSNCLSVVPHILCSVNTFIPFYSSITTINIVHIGTRSTGVALNPFRIHSAPPTSSTTTKRTAFNIISFSCHVHYYTYLNHIVNKKKRPFLLGRLILLLYVVTTYPNIYMRIPAISQSNTGRLEQLSCLYCFNVVFITYPFKYLVCIYDK